MLFVRYTEPIRKQSLAQPRVWTEKKGVYANRQFIEAAGLSLTKEARFVVFVDADSRRVAITSFGMAFAPDQHYPLAFTGRGGGVAVNLAPVRQALQDLAAGLGFGLCLSTKNVNFPVSRCAEIDGAMEIDFAALFPAAAIETPTSEKARAPEEPPIPAAPDAAAVAFPAEGTPEPTAAPEPMGGSEKAAAATPPAEPAPAPETESPKRSPGRPPKLNVSGPRPSGPPNHKQDPKPEPLGILASFPNLPKEHRSSFNAGVRAIWGGRLEQASIDFGCSDQALFSFMKQERTRFDKIQKCRGTAELAAEIQAWHEDLQKAVAA